MPRAWPGKTSIFAIVLLGSIIMPDWYGMEKGQKPERRKNGKPNDENSLQVDRGEKWPRNEFSIFFSISGTLSTWKHLVFYFFPISGFWPFCMPCQPGMIPMVLGNQQRATTDSQSQWARPELQGRLANTHNLRIYPYPMVWLLPRPWSQTMVSDHGLSTENPRNKGISGRGAPIFGFGLADPAPKR